jgi:SAM-dependent methyltransferase
VRSGWRPLIADGPAPTRSELGDLALGVIERGGLRRPQINARLGRVYRLEAARAPRAWAPQRSPTARAILRAVDAWGVGRYEQTAAELAPVSEVAVGALRLRGGERVLDVACGTGNAALLAQRAGAVVTGIDASPRLLQVARDRVAGADFVEGDAARMPFDDASFDAAVSVFGVIFAHPGEQAAAQIARVVRPGGRVVITAWPPRGPLFAAMSLRRRALARSRPPAGPTATVDWGDPAALETLLAPYGDIAVSERELAHDDTSPEEFWDRWERLHPVWIGARRQLEPVGEWEPLREAVIAALRAGAIGEGATSPYLLAVLDRR